MTEQPATDEPRSLLDCMLDFADTIDSEPCNEDRSNFRRWETPRLLPVTALCDTCLDNHRPEQPRPHEAAYTVCCPVCIGDLQPPSDPAPLGDNLQGTRAFCGCCRGVAIVGDPRRLR